VTIADTAPEILSLSRFTVKRFVTAFNPSDIAYQFANQGDTVLAPKGDIILYNQRGEEVASIAVNPDGRTVPPGEQTVFNAGVPTDGLLGKYKAYLNVRYGENQAAVYDTVYFYVLPWKKLLIGLGVFLALCVLVALYMHRRYAHTEDDEEADEVYIETRPVTARMHDRDIVMKR
jgi:hypothetical protein